MTLEHISPEVWDEASLHPNDALVLDAVTAALGKGIPHEEAAIAIAGSAEAYLDMINRTLAFIGDGSLEVDE